jgi:hypothetical protein
VRDHESIVGAAIVRIFLVFRAAKQEFVRALGRGVEEVLGGQVEADVHFAAGGPQAVQAAVGDLFGDEDTGHERQFNPSGASES